MRSKGERLATTPAETHSRNLTVRCRNLLCIIDSSIQIGIDNRRIKPGDSFCGRVHAWKSVGTAAVGAKTGKQIRSNNNKTFRREFVRHLLGPVTKTEDFVNKNDNRRLGLHLRIDNKCLNRAVTMLEGNIFMMARRRLKASLRPLLRVQGGGSKRKKKSSGEQLESAWHCYRHGQEFSWKKDGT